MNRNIPLTTSANVERIAVGFVPSEMVHPSELEYSELEHDVLSPATGMGLFEGMSTTKKLLLAAAAAGAIYWFFIRKKR